MNRHELNEPMGERECGPAVFLHSGYQGAGRGFVCFKGGSPKVKESEAEKEFSRVALETWERGNKINTPLMKRFMAEVDALDTQPSRDFSAGLANQHSMNEFGKLVPKVMTGLSQHGVNPNSGRARAGLAEVSRKGGGAAGENMNRADVSVSEEYGKGLLNVVNVLKGEGAKASAGMGGLARSAAAKAKSDAFNAFNERAANQQAVAAVAGAGLRYGLGASWGQTPSGAGTEMAGRQGDWDYADPGLRHGEMVG